MRSQRVIVIAGLLAALVAAAPAAGATSTLLSGYGAPGQGNQAILGSTVVKGGGGGGASGGSSSPATGAKGSAAASEESGAEPSLVASESSPPANATSSTATGAGSPRHAPSTTHGRAARSQAAQPTVARASFYPASEHLAPGQQDGALGLSGGDLLFLLLGVAVLVSLGVLTRRAGEPGGQRAGG